MRTALQPGRQRSHHAVTPRQGESPKAFFQWLRNQPQYVHRLFAQWLTEAGFEVRSVLRQEAQPVWGARMRRGRVPQGNEEQVARQTICAGLKRFGVKYQLCEVDVLVQADRVESYFLFDKGHPGMLTFDRGQEQWIIETPE
jgi:hypothetical protein